MKVELRELMLLIFIGTTIVSIGGLLHYWNPNSYTLSNVFGNYSHKIYFFFLVNLIGMIGAFIYEYTFKDLISLVIFFTMALTYLMVLWISEDVADSFRFKSHVILASIGFLSINVYILYHAYKRKDLLLWLLFLMSLGLFCRIITATQKATIENESPDILFEEISMIVLVLLCAARRGNYL